MNNRKMLSMMLGLSLLMNTIPATAEDAIIISEAVTPQPVRQ